MSPSAVVPWPDLTKKLPCPLPNQHLGSAREYVFKSPCCESQNGFEKVEIELEWTSSPAMTWEAEGLRHHCDALDA